VISNLLRLSNKSINRQKDAIYSVLDHSETLFRQPRCLNDRCFYGGAPKIITEIEFINGDRQNDDVLS
jgi:hypothetical protein